MNGTPEVSRAWSGGRVMALSAGTVLLVAAGLKCYELWRDPTVVDPVLGTRLGAAGAIVAEMALGTWLWCGSWPVLTRWMAVACFSSFALFSIWATWHGKATCACFGPVQVVPWLTALLDVVLLGLLIWFSAPQPVLTMKVGANVVSASVVLAVGLIASQRLYVKTSEQSLPLQVATDFGAQRQGEKAEIAVEIHNSTKEEITIADVRPSCPCLALELQPRTLAAGTHRTAKVNLDLSREPDFVGDLEGTLEGRTADGRLALKVRATIKVLPRP